MITALLAVSLVSFEIREGTQRADWYVSAQKLKVDAKECEEFLAQTEREMGVKVPPFDYRRVEKASEVSLLGEIYAGGTVYFDQQAGWQVVSMRPCSKHEIVHLITMQIGRADPVFEEGIATMLAGDNGWLDRHNAKNDASHLLKVPPTYASIDHAFRRQTGSASERWREYLLADGWVRHLRDLHGVGRLAEFFRAQASGNNSHAAFHTVYGGNLDAAFEYWLYGKKGPPKPKKARHR